MRWIDWQKLEWGTIVMPTAEGCRYGKVNNFTSETTGIFLGIKLGTKNVIRIVKKGCAMYENYHYSFWKIKDG
jgi:hypothetical protein